MWRRPCSIRRILRSISIAATVNRHLAMVTRAAASVCLVISPWAKHNYIDHTVTEQASILRFIEDNWGLDRIDDGTNPKPGTESFDRYAGSLEGMLDLYRQPNIRRRLLEEDLEKDLVVQAMRRRNILVDRETYIGLNWAGCKIRPWTWEHEEELPELWRDYTQSQWPWPKRNRRK
jgi:Phosphoesterase family